MARCIVPPPLGSWPASRSGSAGCALAGTATTTPRAASDLTEVQSGSWSNDTSRLELRPDGTIRGDSGCNIVFGDWQPASGGVAFGTIGATQMGCPGLDWEQLPSTAEISSAGMTLVAGDGSTIAQLDPDPAPASSLQR